MKHLLAYQLVTILALSVSIWADVRKKGPVSLLSFFLTFTVLIEVSLGTALAALNGNNFFAYNVYNLGCVIFFYFFYRNDVSEKFDWIFILWFLFALVLTFRNGIFSSFDSAPYLTGLSLVAIVVLKFLYENIFVDQSSKLFWNDKFWLALGILIIFFCLFPFLSFFNLIYQDNESFEAYNIIVYSANMLLNLGYLMAAITRWRVN